jgi:hypothetical protein
VTGPHSALEITVLLLHCVIAWALSHGYRGLFHDAGLYTLQALARLTATSLGHDLFLRFGSQDRYTIFSPSSLPPAGCWAWRQRPRP